MQSLVNMRAFSLAILQFTIFTSAFAQSRELITENCNVSYSDRKLADVSCGVFTNDKNEVGIKGSVMMKLELPDDTKMNFKAFRIINDKEYQFFRVERRLKDFLEMDHFDLQGLFVRNTLPPITWPVKKGVTFQVRGWVPDNSKFPPTMPTGKWLAKMTEILPNKTITFTFNWYFKTV